LVGEARFIVNVAGAIGTTIEISSGKNSMKFVMSRLACGYLATESKFHGIIVVLSVVVGVPDIYGGVGKWGYAI